MDLDFTKIREDFFIEVVLDLSRIVIEMPIDILSPLQEIEEIHTVTLECKARAQAAIDKYSDYMSSRRELLRGKKWERWEKEQQKLDQQFEKMRRLREKTAINTDKTRGMAPR